MRYRKGRSTPCASCHGTCPSNLTTKHSSGYTLWDQADWLLLGGLVALALRTGSLTRKSIRFWMYLSAGVGLLGFPLAVFLDTAGPLARWQRAALTPFGRAPVFLIYVSMLLLVVLRNRGKEERVTPSAMARVFMFLGYISYGLYLVHPLVYAAVERWSAWLGGYRTDPLAFAGCWLIETAASVGIAYLSRRYFEEFSCMKERRARASAVPALP